MLRAADSAAIEEARGVLSEDGVAHELQNLATGVYDRGYHAIKIRVQQFENPVAGEPVGYSGEITQVAEQQRCFERLDLTAAGTSGEDALGRRVPDIGVEQGQLGLPQAAKLTGRAERRPNAFEQRLIRVTKA